MDVLKILIFASFVSGIFMFRNKYKIIQENITIEYQNGRYIDISAGVCNYNETPNALNVTFTVKIDLPENVKLTLRAYKLLDTDLAVCQVQIDKTLKSVTEMKSYGLRALWVEYTHPAVSWPLEKEITYQLLGWVPDSRKFPPSVHPGKWKIEATTAFDNKTIIFIANWFARIVYEN